MNSPDKASVSCYATQSPPAGGDFTVNTMYSKNNFQLADFERAVAVAQAYQFYRVSGITVKFKPNVDTFDGTKQKTYLYVMVDKGGNIPPNITLEGLKRMGAKPMVLDEKARTIKWKPGVVTGVADDATTLIAAQYKTSPWLNTNLKGDAPGLWNPSTVDHRGIIFYVEQQGSTVAYKVDIQVNFDFKKPLWGLNISVVPPTTFGNARTDNSADGLADTPDT